MSVSENNTDLQQLIQNAITTALQQSNVITKNNPKEDVSTSSAISDQAKELSRLACSNRLKRIGK